MKLLQLDILTWLNSVNNNSNTTLWSMFVCVRACVRACTHCVIVYAYVCLCTCVGECVRKRIGEHTCVTQWMIGGLCMLQSSLQATLTFLAWSTNVLTARTAALPQFWPRCEHWLQHSQRQNLRRKRPVSAVAAFLLWRESPWRRYEQWQHSTGAFHAFQA